MTVNNQNPEMDSGVEFDHSALGDEPTQTIDCFVAKPFLHEEIVSSIEQARS